jgi:hypothetical protein
MAALWEDGYKWLVGKGSGSCVSESIILEFSLETVGLGGGSREASRMIGSVPKHLHRVRFTIPFFI